MGVKIQLDRGEQGKAQQKKKTIKKIKKKKKHSLIFTKEMNRHDD